MYEMGGSVFLSMESEHVLHQGCVIGLQADTVVAEFLDPIVPAVGSEITLQVTWRDKFFQQKMRVAALRQTEPTLVAALVQVGEAQPSEHRVRCRVSTTALEIRARIGEDTWQVVDVSAEGFAILTRRLYERGAVMSVTVWGEGMSCAGRIRVATARRMEDGSMRYGLVPTEDDTSLGDALVDVKARVESIQLRRLSRIA